ncbi:MAG: MT-A70 family methyltransferase [Planctomycetota bacterium]|nr:MT-A70 family methyltransferase [Planctomycetota bacterium]
MNSLFEDPTPEDPVAHENPQRQNPAPGRVRDLQSLVDLGHRFPTIYADPPWEYANRVARGAASRHYRTMTLDDICGLPVSNLTTDDAHLHLWTTNGFLSEAFQVIKAWGFEYKSCFVWVKPELGCGNYWRVSHEFLLLGVRGRLPFRERTHKSWLLHHRREHSRKPESVRLLIEQVSPGPYLELFGRAEVPNSDWTVFGNQVERRLF